MNFAKWMIQRRNQNRDVLKLDNLARKANIDVKNHHECCICMDICSAPIHCATCKIPMHLQCVVDMIQTSPQYNKCPVCRQSLPPHPIINRAIYQRDARENLIKDLLYHIIDGHVSEVSFTMQRTGQHFRMPIGEYRIFSILHGLQ
jgi:hypothetical protein